MNLLLSAVLTDRLLALFSLIKIKGSSVSGQVWVQYNHLSHRKVAQYTEVEHVK